MTDQFYLQDSRSHVGDGLQFWAKGGHGYVTDLDKAELFTKEQACRHRDTDIPWPKDYIDARAHYGVDHQFMDERASDAMLSAGCRVYVQAPGAWNGNDVYWVHHRPGKFTEDVGLAFAMSLEQAKADHGNGMLSGARKIWHADYIDTIRRRLVHRQNVDIKQALRGTGIKLPKAKPQNRRSYSNLTNCHGCGRFLSEAQRYGDCPKCGAENRP